ncbi:protein of unknown function [Burkholderia multivorans]
MGPTRYGHQAKGVVAPLRSATNPEEAVILGCEVVSHTYTSLNRCTSSASHSTFDIRKR